VRHVLDGLCHLDALDLEPELAGIAQTALQLHPLPLQLPAEASDLGPDARDLVRGELTERERLLQNRDIVGQAIDLVLDDLAWPHPQLSPNLLFHIHHRVAVHLASSRLGCSIETNVEEGVAGDIVT
jgi:hypothetical protein